MRRSGFLTTVSAVLVGAAAVPSGFAQAPATATRVAVIAEDLTRVNSVRELSDGRVLLVDRGTLYVVTPGARPKQPIGRSGQGPGEYETLRWLQPLGVDSTLAFETAYGRIQLLVKDSFSKIPELLRDRRAPDLNLFAGMDKAGNILKLQGVGKATGGGLYDIYPNYARELGAIRIDARGQVDTVARLKGLSTGHRKVKALVDEGRMNFEVINPLATHEQAALFTDGRISLARHEPYRVDWIFPNGSRVAGAPLEPDSPVTSAIRKEMVDNFVRRKDGSPAFQESDFPPFPKTVPAFKSSALHAGADGRLYITRTQIDRDGIVLVDAVSQDGKRTQFQLPARSQLVGTGTRGLYVAIKDDDDVQTLVLYKFPL